MCVHKLSELLYRNLRGVCSEHIGEALRALAAAHLAKDDAAFLTHMDAAWQTHCAQMALIRSIFLYLDRSFVVPLNEAKVWLARSLARALLPLPIPCPSDLCACATPGPSLLSHARFCNPSLAPVTAASAIWSVIVTHDMRSSAVTQAVCAQLPRKPFILQFPSSSLPFPSPCLAPPLDLSSRLHASSSKAQRNSRSSHIGGRGLSGQVRPPGAQRARVPSWRAGPQHLRHGPAPLPAAPRGHPPGALPAPWPSLPTFQPSLSWLCGCARAPNTAQRGGLHVARLQMLLCCAA